MSIGTRVEPRSASRSDSIQAELVEQFLERLQAGESLDPSAFAAQYPEHAKALGQLLPALQMMAELSRSAVRDRCGLPVSEAISASELGVVGDFRILREVGRGGMGVVYEAEQLSLHRRVALKVLPLAGGLDPRQLQRFKTEAQAAALLHHTNIVPIHAVGCERGVHYYAMQFIDGQTLAQLINERRSFEHSPPIDDGPSASPAVTAAARSVSPTPSSRTGEFMRMAATLGIQAALALDHAHGQGVIHRDIKPANLLLDAAGRLWITDFGLARLQDDNGLTMTGDLLGTLRYMSPEQALARRGYLDHRADIYSLGATLYELLTLRPAIEGQDRQELMHKIAHEEPAPPRKLNPATPRELETILQKAMSKEPESRYATAQELADDLRRFLENKPIKAKRPSAYEQISKWVRRHPSTLVGTAAASMTTAIILAVAIVLIAREQVTTQAAIKRARDEEVRARQFAATAQANSVRAGYRLSVVLQGLDHLLLRLHDRTLPDSAQVRELRRSVREHSRRTIEGFIDESSRDPRVLSESIEACHHLANLCFVSGEIKEAITAFEQAIRLGERLVTVDPSKPDHAAVLGTSHNILGLQLYASGLRSQAIDHFERARKDYLRAVELDPQRFESLRRLRWFLAICPEASFRDPGRVLELTARMIEKEKDTRSARPYDPSLSPHWLLEGIAHYRKGDFRAAIDTLEPPLAPERHGTESLYGAGDIALGCFVLAMAYHHAGDGARALDRYRSATRVMNTSRPSDTELAIFRAEAAALLGVTDHPMSTREKEENDKQHSTP